MYKGFTFYTVYLNKLNKLNAFQFKKVINALCNYVENDVIPEKLSGKSMAVFNQLQTVILAEQMELISKENKSKAGKKGAASRWNGKKWQDDGKK